MQKLHFFTLFTFILLSTGNWSCWDTSIECNNKDNCGKECSENLRVILLNCGKF